MTKEEIKKRLHNGNCHEILGSASFLEAVKLCFEINETITDMPTEEVQEIATNVKSMILDESVPLHVKYMFIRILCESECPHKRMLLEGQDELKNIISIGVGNYTGGYDEHSVEQLKYIRCNFKRLKDKEQQ